MTDMTYGDRLAALEQELAALREGRGGESTEPFATPLGWFQVAPGQTILSDHMNTAVLQGMVPFASAAARDAAIPAPVAGMVCYLADLQQVQLRTGGTWCPIAGKMPGWFIHLASNTANFTQNSWTEVPWTNGVIGAFNGGDQYVQRSGSRIQILKAGVYRIEAQIAMGGAIIPFAQVAVTTNGTAPTPLTIQSMLAASSGPVGTLVTSTNLGGFAASDFVSIMSNPSVAAYAQSGSHVSVIYQGP